MSAATLTPLDEYLVTAYRPDCEYIDGRLLERNAGEWDHSRLQMLLSRYLSNREKEWSILVVPEQRFHVHRQLGSRSQRRRPPHSRSRHHGSAF